MTLHTHMLSIYGQYKKKYASMLLNVRIVEFRLHLELIRFLPF